MIITCEACGTSFKIKTSLIKETGSTVRCSKCQQVFVAYPKSPEDEKPTDFELDQALESKIDDVLGDEFDDEFSDLESEISLDTAEVTMSTSEELFDTADSDSDDLKEGFAEPEIMMSELEQDDDILSLDDLASGATAEEVFDLGAFLDEGEEEEEEGEVLSFGDLGAKSTVEDDSEILSFDDLDQEEEITLDDLESTAEQDEDVTVFDDLDTGAAAEEDIFSEESIEEDEEDIDFLDFEDQEVQPDEETEDDDIEMALEEELKEEAEPEEIVLETEGGVDTDLDEFDLEKELGEEDTSEGTAEEAGKKEEAEKPAEETSKIEEDEELDLDFDLGEEAEAEPGAEEAVEAEADEMDLDLELEEDDFEVTSTAEAEAEDFEMDLDLATVESAEAPEAISIEEDDLGLDLDGFEDLDLTEEAAPEAADEDDLGLDLDAAEDDLGLDLDLDEFEDLDLEDDLATIDSETIADDDFDLDLDLGAEEEAPAVEAEAEAEDDFDLDFDLGDEAEAEAGAEEETFELDLNIEPEPVEAETEADEFDLDLDFDDGLGDESATLAESFVDEDDGSVTKTEEFDLTQIEDVLDFDEMPEPEEVRAGDDLDDLGMELEESEPDTVSDDDEMSIDLETMLDDEEMVGEEKEVSLETVGERDKQIEKEYKKTVIEERETPEEIIEDIPEEVDAGFEDETMVQMPAEQVGEKRNLKKVLIPLILLIAVGALIYAGIQMFTGKEEAPVPPPAVTDQGNLQIEMIANPEYKFVENSTSGEILVITGTVTNRYDHPRSNVQVKGTLYDNAGKVIVTSSSYSGNMLSDSELASLEIKTINERLNNRTGDNNMNTDIASGAKIPFTVVFSSLPADMNEFTVEVVQSVK